MRSRKSILVAGILGGGLLLVMLALLAGYLVLRSMDLNSYRPQIIAQIKAATGRELSITGDISAGLGDGLEIRVDGLALSNADWGSRPDMLTMGHAEARLALLPLLGGQVRVRRISLYEADLLLETDASGRANWLFDTGPQGEGTATLGVDEITIESGRILWQPAGGNPWQISNLVLDVQPEGDYRLMQASARVEGHEARLSGRIPSLLIWMAPGPLDLDLRLEILGADIMGKGTITQEAWGRNPALAVRGSGLDIAALAGLAGVSLPAVPGLDIAFDLSRDATDWRIANLGVTAGASDLSGGLTITPAAETGVVRVKADLSSKHLALDELLPRAPKPGTTSAGPMFDPQPLALGVLRTLEATLRLRVGEVTGLAKDLQDVVIDGHLDGGRLELTTVSADIRGGGHAAGGIELDAGATPTDWHGDLKLRQASAAVLLGLDGSSLIEAPADLDLQLRTRGDSPAQMAKGLSGTARLVVGEGKARMKAIDRMVGGLSTLTGQLLEKGSDDAQLNCVIAEFTVEGGIAEASVLLIDSAVSTVRGDGRIDLGAERLDLTFTPNPKKPTLSVAVPVHVRGPLRRPEFILDRVESLKRMVGVAGLFVYPPAALATLGDLGGTDNECIRLMQGGAPTSHSGSVTDKVQGAAKGIGSRLKNLLSQ